MEDSNVSGNPGFHAVSLPARRRLLQAGFASASALLLGCAGVPGPRDTRLGFEGIAADRGDRVTVPPGYQVDVIARWGEAVGLAGRMPAWRDDAGNSADEQALQLGMHHDGMAFFALDAAGTRGLLVINHEYADEGLLHAAGASAAERVRKSQAAHGLSVVEVALRDGHWQLLRPSAHARRITLATPITLSGHAAGHPLLRTAADPQGLQVLGTLNNCAGSRTPWGTYLAGEENWAGYFGGGDARSTDQRRWGLQPQGWSGWERHDERFDTRRHPNEFHRFGWIVELDPLDPRSTPVKRTALGRGAHEGAWVGTRPDGRAVVYSGEDARFEYLYRFVSRDRIAPGGARSNATLLDHGTLSVARFDADGRGRWLPLVQGQGLLTAANGFADQGQVLVHTRQAADLLGATKMDRPEWMAIDPRSGEVFCTLTNNSRRGADGQPGPDAANPRAGNSMGHIIRWTDDADGQTFRWQHLLLAGNPALARADARGNINGDAFACPDSLVFDPAGRLWIGTDIGPDSLNRGDMAGLGNNQLLACDPVSGQVRRFLTGPVGCEITGPCFTPDGRTLFVNVQHPGEPPDADNSDPAQPRRWSNWPDHNPNGRPRSATLAIRRADGGIIGA